MAEAAQPWIGMVRSQTQTAPCTDDATNTPQEMVVIKFDKAGQKLEVDPAKNRIDKVELMRMVEVGDHNAG